MTENYQSFEGFTSAAEKAIFYFIRPYGIYHKGEVYWDEKLPRKKGTVVRYFEDTSGPCTSLVVLTMDGEFITSAYPISWHEDDHPAIHEMNAWWAMLSPEEQQAILDEQD